MTIDPRNPPIPHIKLHAPGLISNNWRVTHIDKDGTETDISNTVSEITVHAKVDELTTATLTVFAGVDEFRVVPEGITVLTPDNQ